MSSFYRATLLFSCVTTFLSNPGQSFGMFQWEDYRPEPAPLLSNQSALDSSTPDKFKPLWGIEVGAIWLSRKTPDAQNLVFDQSGARVRKT